MALTFCGLLSVQERFASGTRTDGEVEGAQRGVTGVRTGTDVI